MEDIMGNLYRAKEQLAFLSKKHKEDLRALINILVGHVLSKYTYKSGKKHERFFSISPDLEYLQWKTPDSNKKLRKIPIDSIVQVSDGNEKFTCSKKKVNLTTDEPSLCFSVHTENKVVNVACYNPIQKMSWVIGLNYLQAYWNPVDTDDGEEFDKIMHMCLERFQIVIHKAHSKKEKYKKAVQKLNKKFRYLEEENAKLKSQLEGNRNSQEVITDRLRNTEEFASLEQEYEEYKRQIKETFTDELTAKTKKYKKSKQVLTNYSEQLKQDIQEMANQIRLWKEIVYHFAAPTLQTKNNRKDPEIQEVLAFAISTIEDKFNAESAQHDFVTVISTVKRDLSKH